MVFWVGQFNGVALAMRHRLCGLSTYRLNGFEREMSTPPTLRRGTADFTFYLFKFNPDRPLLPWQRNVKKNRLQLGLRKRYPRFWRLTGGFRGRVIEPFERCQSNSTTSDLGCTATTFEDKISSANVTDIFKILAFRPV